MYFRKPNVSQSGNGRSAELFHQCQHETISYTIRLTFIGVQKKKREQQQIYHQNELNKINYE